MGERERERKNHLNSIRQSNDSNYDRAFSLCEKYKYWSLT